MTLQGIPDASTVNADGVSKKRLIDGVIVRQAVTHVDDRGSLTEIYNPAWGTVDFPLVYVYQTMIRPGKVKGWLEHRIQTDRLFLSIGAIMFVLYDNRPESPTYQMINEVFMSEENRALLIIPPRVIHGVQNIGTTSAVFINTPSHPYNHEKPDKYRFPLDGDDVPYRFGDKLGW
jgi:dTDP-4-dehydrorhamnose 3,5-epimerase